MIQSKDVVFIEMPSSLTEENHADAMRIVRSLEIVNQVMTDLSGEVGQQGETLAVVEWAVDSASHPVKQGTDNLDIANHLKNRVRLKRWSIAFLVLCMIAGIVGLLYAMRVFP
jgi:t-SNARE complex subunit (syntaxin)